ncbi:MAG: methyltransferase domain-containing protein [bacterium]|nr:methyltransferase domain-containing protein [bacterium]MCY4273145.1 methyltransferase domain-containing protein [bacterium]
MTLDREFAAAALSSLGLGPRTRLLAVCASTEDWDVLCSLGFTDVVVSNLDETFAPLVPEGAWSYQDAQSLAYDDRSFDWVFVSEGLHHCRSPHRALVEMYRVCRVGIVAIEARDSPLVRLAVRLGMADAYELAAVADQGFRAGGLDNTSVPNHVYRWTESEVVKTLRSYDPTGEPLIEFRYGLRLPTAEATGGRRRVAGRMSRPVLRAMSTVFKRQCNQLAIIARRPTGLYPWLHMVDGQAQFNPGYRR